MRSLEPDELAMREDGPRPHTQGSNKVEGFGVDRSPDMFSPESAQNIMVLKDWTYLIQLMKPS